MSAMDFVGEHGEHEVFLIDNGELIAFPVGAQASCHVGGTEHEFYFTLDAGLCECGPPDHTCNDIHPSETDECLGCVAELVTSSTLIKEVL